MELIVLILNFGSLLFSFKLCTALSIVGQNVQDTNEVVLNRQRRKVTNKDSNLWRDGNIPYIVDDDISKNYALQSAIDESIKQTEKTTCIKFHKQSDNLVGELGKTQRYVQFVKGIGCHSSVGMGQKSGAQKLSIGRSCGFPEMVLHELGHLIGLWHEQARPDRDAHVRINWGNIKEGMEHNFKMVDDARLWAPYDLSSAMHYSLQTFQQSEGNTIQPLDNSLGFLVGYRRDFSFYDLYTIHRMYGCSDHCPEDSPKCENEGFLDKNCKCVCPKLLHGETCGEIETDSDCGGVINVESTYEVTSPRYPKHYVNNNHCAWLFKSAVGTIMTIEAHVFIVEMTSTGICRDTLEIRSTNIGVESGPELCGEFYNRSKNTTTNKLILDFNSDKAYSGKGFNLTLRVIQRQDCDSFPCQNGGSCVYVDAISDYMCKCALSYIGKDCEMKVVEGGLTEWSAWSECTAACGLQHRSRTCTDPEPQNGGRGCTGSVEELQHCHSHYIDCSKELTCGFGVMGQVDNCGVSIEGSSAMQWSFIYSATPSMNTGPPAGHTIGDPYDYFIYLEGSYGAHEETTTFWLPKRLWDAGVYCLQFYYYMHGEDVGTLQVLRRAKANRQAVVIWQDSHEKGEQWIEANMDVLVGKQVQVGFLGVKGDGFDSDIAIDDISLSPGSCSMHRNQQTGCMSNGNNYMSGKHYSIDKGCVRKQCYCNYNGQLDCPKWDQHKLCYQQNSGTRRTINEGNAVRQKKKTTTAKKQQQQREREKRKRQRQKQAQAAAAKHRKLPKSNI